MGNRSYGKGLFDGMAKGEAQGYARGRRENTWQSIATTAASAGLLLGYTVWKDRRATKLAGSPTTEQAPAAE